MIFCCLFWHVRAKIRWLIDNRIDPFELTIQLRFDSMYLQTSIFFCIGLYEKFISKKNWRVSQNIFTKSVWGFSFCWQYIYTYTFIHKLGAHLSPGDKVKTISIILLCMLLKHMIPKVGTTLSYPSQEG